MIQTLAILPLLAVSAETLEHNKELVRRVYEEAINQSKLEVLEALIASSYTNEKGDKGPKAYRATVEGLKRAFPDLRFTIHALIAEGDKVAVRWSWTGTHKNAFREYPASGKVVKNTGIALYTIKEGKVISVELEADRLGVLQQIGATISPGK